MKLEVSKREAIKYLSTKVQDAYIKLNTNILQGEDQEILDGDIQVLRMEVSRLEDVVDKLEQ